MSTPGLPYNGQATLEATEMTGAMSFDEDNDTLMDLLTVRYPLRVVFVGQNAHRGRDRRAARQHPHPVQADGRQQVASRRATSPTPAPRLLNWNKQHYLEGENPYFIGMKYKYDLQILTASKAYAKALFNVAKKSAPRRTRRSTPTSLGANLAAYDETQGQFRVAAKGGDPAYKVIGPDQDRPGRRLRRRGLDLQLAHRREVEVRLQEPGERQAASRQGRAGHAGRLPRPVLRQVRPRTWTGCRRA